MQLARKGKLMIPQEHTIRFILSLLLTALPIAAAETVREHPDKRLAANVVEVVAMINRGDEAELTNFVRERYGDKMLGDMPAAGHVTFLKNVHDGKSPLELCCYQISERVPENMAIAILRGRADTWSALQIRFDADDKITSFMLMPTKPPLDFVNLKKLDDAGLAREFDAYLTGLAANDEFSGVALIARDGKRSWSRRTTSSPSSRTSRKSSRKRPLHSSPVRSGPTATPAFCCWGSSLRR